MELLLRRVPGGIASRGLDHLCLSVKLLTPMEPGCAASCLWNGKAWLRWELLQSLETEEVWGCRG